MKKYLFFLIACISLEAVYAQGYTITLHNKGFNSGIAYLAYWMGNNLNVQDSGAINSAGTVIFTSSKRLPGGIYAIVFPDKRTRTEFLVGEEQEISITTDISDLINKTVITGSKENVQYDAYQKFVSAKGKLMEEAKAGFNSSTTRADSLRHEKNYNAANNELNAYRENIIKTTPESMLAVLLSAMREPTVPVTRPLTRQDSMRNYYYYKAHFWDGISFMDEKVIRTPFFLNKLQRYYREVMPQVPDSVIKDIDYKLLLARSEPEMYKYLLNWLTDEYIQPKYMGMDAVFVHLFDKYHSKGASFWLNENQMEIISRRAYMLMANLVGEKAANLEMVDSTGKPAQLYDVVADFTVVSFWDPKCGHCKEEMPRLDSIYQASWKNHKVKIYAVLSPDGKADVKNEWVSFIKEKKLNLWIHVYQTKEKEAADFAAQRAGFRQLYDVTSTPTLYLLDKDKNIVGKKLTILQLHGLLEAKWKNKSPN